MDFPRPNATYFGPLKSLLRAPGPLWGWSSPLLSWLLVLLAASCLAKAALDAQKPPASILGGIFLPKTMIVGLFFVASRASVFDKFF